MAALGRVSVEPAEADTTNSPPKSARVMARLADMEVAVLLLPSARCTASIVASFVLASNSGGVVQNAPDMTAEYLSATVPPTRRHSVPMRINSAVSPKAIAMVPT
ncbi:hypothetical protein D3C84_1044030 [compost metagenome]